MDAPRTSFRIASTARRSIVEAKLRGVTTLFEPLSSALVDEVQWNW
jgi:hypothetical protein